LPSHSPKLNGAMERLSLASREEIYEPGQYELLSISEHNQLRRTVKEICDQLGIGRTKWYRYVRES